MHADSTAMGEGASHFDENHYQAHSINNDSQQEGKQLQSRVRTTPPTAATTTPASLDSPFKPSLPVDCVRY